MTSPTATEPNTAKNPSTSSSQDEPSEPAKAPSTKPNTPRQTAPPVRTHANTEDRRAVPWSQRPLRTATVLALNTSASGAAGVWWPARPSKPLGRGSPPLGRFDSFAAPFGGCDSSDRADRERSLSEESHPP